MPNLIFLLIIKLCFQITTKSSNESDCPKLIQHPVPFYLYEKNNLPYFLGIETKRFKLICNDTSVWILNDRYVDARINLAELDEYVFIQSDLKDQLQKIRAQKKALYFPIDLHITELYQQVLPRAIKKEYGQPQQIRLK